MPDTFVVVAVGDAFQSEFTLCHTSLIMVGAEVIPELRVQGFLTELHHFYCWAVVAVDGGVANSLLRLAVVYFKRRQRVERGEAGRT